MHLVIGVWFIIFTIVPVANKRFITISTFSQPLLSKKIYFIHGRSTLNVFYNRLNNQEYCIWTLYFYIHNTCTCTLLFWQIKCVAYIHWEFLKVSKLHILMFLLWDIFTLCFVYFLFLASCPLLLVALYPRFFLLTRMFPH